MFHKFNNFASFQLSVNLHIALLLLFLLVAVLFTLYIYRITIPQISKVKKIVLTILRSAAIFFIFLVLFEPLLSLISKTYEKPILAVLIDNSRSMSLIDKEGDRAGIVKNIISENVLGDINKIGEINYITFFDKIKHRNNFTSDSLVFSGNVTDLSMALKEIKKYYSEKNLQNLLIITDGEYNVGQNPIYQAESFSRPINIIGIGDSSEQKDISITRVITNNIVYKDSKVPVSAIIKSSGFKNETLDVGLYDQSKLIESKKISVKEGTSEYPLDFSYEPKEEGLIKYHITVSSMKDEITDKNNKKDFFVKVLKNKIKVLIISGAPSSDVSFIKNACLLDKNIEVKSFIQKQSGGFYEGNISKSVLDSAECLFIIGFPTSISQQDVINVLRTSIEQKNIPIFFIMDNNLDYQKLKYFEPFLPFVVTQINNNEFLATVNVLSGQAKNPLLKITGTDADILLWNKLPPIFKTETNFSIKPEGQILANIMINNIAFNSPLLVTSKIYKQKSLAILGYGIWRWKLLGEGLESNDNLFQTFISNSLRWLTTREDESLLKVIMPKEIFNTGEKIEFFAQAYNESYEPLDNATVNLKVSKNDINYEIQLLPQGMGRYIGSMEELSEGDYYFTAKADYNNKFIGESKGRFTVGELNLEYQNTQMNATLLKQIALKTGGQFYTKNNYYRFIEELKNDKSFINKEVVHKSEIQLWNIFYLLVFIVLLLSIEWFVRKKSGML